MRTAQSLFLLLILGSLLLSFAVEGVFAWLFPISSIWAAYYAWTMFRSGYALGQNCVYERRKDPFMYNVHLWGAIVITFVALFASLS